MLTKKMKNNIQMCCCCYCLSYFFVLRNDFVLFTSIRIKNERRGGECHLILYIFYRLGIPPNLKLILHIYICIYLTTIEQVQFKLVN